ncbi:MAG: alpha/beta hydrolase [Lachnospiraceae bacterium]|nr:alpha/beta hydrolase [Lachnospiraceae bacterium]
MDYKESIDPELRKGAKSYPFNRFYILTGNAYQKLEWRFTRIPESLQEDTIVTEGFQGLSMKTTVFSPAGAGDKLPALIYVHGGAFCYEAAAYQKKLACIYAERAECKVFFPHYHLSPKYQYPAAYEDLLSLYRYVTAHTAELGIDADRIGVAGDSAGATLAAMISHHCEEEKLPPPVFQMLVYPMTDADPDTASMKYFRDTPMWDASEMDRMWTYYCGNDRERRYQAVPMRCELPRTIPKTYIEAAEFDCLHDEGLLYGEKLQSAGASVEINDTKGTYHGYDRTLDAEIVKRNVDRRISFIRSVEKTPASTGGEMNRLN